MEIRDAQFYGLYAEVSRTWPRPLPNIVSRIYQSPGAEVRVVVGVSGTNTAGTEYCWSLHIETRGDSLRVEGSIEECPAGDDSFAEIYERSEETDDIDRACEFIHQIADDVCGQRRWLATDPSDI